MECPSAADTLKGGWLMVDTAHVREEVFSYISACEGLIAVATMPGEPMLSVHERQVIDYYAAELSKVVVLPPPTDDQLGLFAATTVDG